MKMEYAEGYWCTECEMFEEPDVVEDRCLACGCSERTHRRVKVVDL